MMPLPSVQRVDVDEAHIPLVSRLDPDGRHPLDLVTSVDQVVLVGALGALDFHDAAWGERQDGARNGDRPARLADGVDRIYHEIQKDLLNLV